MMTTPQTRLGSIVLLTLLTVARVAVAVEGDADVQLISQGREVVLEDHLVPGKMVVFDFYADWCAPCRYLTPQLERLVEQHPDRLAMRKVDVVDWESPVARQYRIDAVPYLVLFGPDGARLAAGDANRVLRVLGSRLGVEGATSHAATRSSGVPPPVWWGLLVALVIGSIVMLRRNRPTEAAARADPGPGSGSADGPPRIWFVMVRGSLEGPYSVDDLARLVESGDLPAEATVRRRGDASWRRLEDVIRVA